MMPRKDLFAQVLCDLATSIEISIQLENELSQIRRLAARRSGDEFKYTTPRQRQWMRIAPAGCSL